jgi:hypothetical protein
MLSRGKTFRLVQFIFNASVISFAVRRNTEICVQEAKRQ